MQMRVLVAFVWVTQATTAAGTAYKMGTMPPCSRPFTGVATEIEDLDSRNTVGDTSICKATGPPPQCPCRMLAADLVRRPSAIATGRTGQDVFIVNELSDAVVTRVALSHESAGTVPQYESMCQFACSGNRAFFKNPIDITVDTVTGDVYVLNFDKNVTAQDHVLIYVPADGSDPQEVDVDASLLNNPTGLSGTFTKESGILYVLNEQQPENAVATSACGAGSQFVSPVVKIDVRNESTGASSWINGGKASARRYPADDAPFSRDLLQGGLPAALEVGLAGVVYVAQTCPSRLAIGPNPDRRSSCASLLTINESTIVDTLKDADTTALGDLQLEAITERTSVAFAADPQAERDGTIFLFVENPNDANVGLISIYVPAAESGTTAVATYFVPHYSKALLSSLRDMTWTPAGLLAITTGGDVVAIQPKCVAALPSYTTVVIPLVVGLIVVYMALPLWAQPLWKAAKCCEGTCCEGLRRALKALIHALLRGRGWALKYGMAVILLCVCGLWLALSAGSAESTQRSSHSHLMAHFGDYCFAGVLLLLIVRLSESFCGKCGGGLKNGALHKWGTCLSVLYAMAIFALHTIQALQSLYYLDLLSAVRTTRSNAYMYSTLAIEAAGNVFRIAAAWSLFILVKKLNPLFGGLRWDEGRGLLERLIGEYTGLDRFHFSEDDMDESEAGLVRKAERHRKRFKVLANKTLLCAGFAMLSYTAAFAVIDVSAGFAVCEDSAYASKVPIAKASSRLSQVPSFFGASQCVSQRVRVFGLNKIADLLLTSATLIAAAAYFLVTQMHRITCESFAEAVSCALDPTARLARCALSWHSTRRKKAFEGDWKHWKHWKRITEVACAFCVLFIGVGTGGVGFGRAWWGVGPEAASSVVNALIYLAIGFTAGRVVGIPFVRICVSAFNRDDARKPGLDIYPLYDKTLERCLRFADTGWHDENSDKRLEQVLKTVVKKWLEDSANSGGSSGNSDDTRLGLLKTVVKTWKDSANSGGSSGNSDDIRSADGEKICDFCDLPMGRSGKNNELLEISALKWIFGAMGIWELFARKQALMYCLNCGKNLPPNSRAQTVESQCQSSLPPNNTHSDNKSKSAVKMTEMVNNPAVGGDAGAAAAAKAAAAAAGAAAAAKAAAAEAAAKAAAAGAAAAAKAAAAAALAAAPGLKISLLKVFREVQQLNATTGFLAKTLRPVATCVLVLGFLHVFLTAFYFIVILIGNDTDINVSGTGAQTPLFWGSLLNMVYMMCAIALIVTGPAEFQRVSKHWRETLHHMHALHVKKELGSGDKYDNVKEVLDAMELSIQFKVFGIVLTYSSMVNICYGLFLGILPFVFLKLSGVST